MKKHFLDESKANSLVVVQTLCGITIDPWGNVFNFDMDESELCENCKRTNAYKQAKAEKKRKDVEELLYDETITACSSGGTVGSVKKGEVKKFTKDGDDYKEVIPDLELTVKVKQYDNKKIELIQALSELRNMYGYQLMNTDIDDCFRFFL